MSPLCVLEQQHADTRHLFLLPGALRLAGGQNKSVPNHKVRRIATKQKRQCACFPQVSGWLFITGHVHHIYSPAKFEFACTDPYFWSLHNSPPKWNSSTAPYPKSKVAKWFRGFCEHHLMQIKIVLQMFILHSQQNCNSQTSAFIACCSQEDFHKLQTVSQIMFLSRASKLSHYHVTHCLWFSFTVHGIKSWQLQVPASCTLTLSTWWISIFPRRRVCCICSQHLCYSHVPQSDSRDHPPPGQSPKDDLELSPFSLT